MSDELKPCPFCGAAEPIPTYSQWSRMSVARIHCPGCGANGPESMPRKTDQSATEEAGRKWNQRAPERGQGA